MSEPPISGPARIFDFRAALWLQLPLIAAAYVAAAWLGYLPTRSGLENLPLHPDAGLALAALLACGLRCWPGVWLGAAITHLWLDAPASSDWLLAAIIASGATLQAVVAALLARRYLQARVPLGREPDVWQFLLLAGPLACLLSASLGTAATALLASTSGPAAAGSWLSWWIGDTLGVLLFTAPMLLAWPGKPPLWEHGGTRVMLPLLITAALLAASNALLAHLEKSQAQEIASKYMEEATNSGFYSLPGYIESLRSIERLFAASGEVTAQEYATFADRVARLPGILSVDWAPRLAGADRASFEATQRPVYALDADGKAVAAGQRAEYYPVLYIAPRDGNSQLIGLDHAHDPQRLAAMQQARDLALPVAVHKRNLVRTRKPVLLVYVPVYRNGLDISQAGLQVRRDALQGFVVGVLDVANLLAPLGHFASRHQLSFRVTDVTPGQSGTVLAGEMPQPADWVREISFGERVLRLELQPDRTYGVAGGSGLARFYLVFSALAAFLVAFAVLGAAGRHAAIASRVADKTADLQAELQARQAAEAALRASEQDLEITLQSIGDAVLATDEHGLVTRMNPVAELLTGWRLDEARGQPVSTVFHIVNEKTRQPADTPVEKVLQSGKQQALANHTVLLVRNGGEHSISESAAPIRNAEGRLCGVVLVFRDVSLQRAAELALQASEERYRQFIERSPYGVFVQCDGKFAFLNPKAVAMLGGESEQQLLGSPVLDFLHPDSRDAVRQRMRLLNEQHVAVPPLEEKWLRLDGSMFFGEATAVPYEYEESSCALVLLNDITARKEAENQLNKFFEISLDMLCIASADGYFKRINPAFSLVLGWDEQELLSRPYMDFVHPDDQAATLREVERQVQSGEKVLSFENRYLHKDGSWRVLSWQSVPHRGGVMFATARDVTRLREADQEIRRLNADLEGRVAERTEALEALHAKQQEVRAILDNMLDCVITIDARGIVRSVNPAVQTLLGYMPEEVIGRNVSMLMSEPPRSDHDGYIASYLHTQVARIIGFTREVEALHKNGGIVPVELAVNKYEVGGEVFFTGSLHDIRERRQLIAELVQARTLAEDASRAKSVFLANMSHEIRTPMNAIIGLSHLCLQTALTDRQRDYVGKVHYSARALLGIINDILDFSKIEAGKLTLEQQDFDLAAVLANVDSVVGHLAREKGLHFEVRRDVAVPQHVMGDALRLGQVLLNLAGNAVKFTQRGSVVLTVLLREEDDGRDVQLEFSVRDTGIGLSEEQVLYIFDPFSQADASTTRKFGGTGLGLTISRRLVDMMGGRLWVDSTLGEGSDFRFTALFRRGSAAPVAARASDDDLAEARRRLHGARLLLAEDNPFNQQVGLELLEAAGASVILADDGEAALKALAEQPCDLVLMDVQMPGMDGYEATRQIRTNPRLAGLRVIAMTANAMAEDRQRCIAAGMDDFITKPIDPDLLYLTLGRWLPQSSHAAPATAAAQPAVGHGDSGVIDLSILGGMLRNNPDKVREFAYKYLQSARDTLAEMQQARSRHDLHELSRLGHRLKSSSRAVGALGFAGLCESLEKCTEWSAAEDLLSRLEQLLQRIEAQVGQELG